MSTFPMITPTLAMFYQVINNKDEYFFDQAGDWLNFYGFKSKDSIRKIKFSYDEALEATMNLDSELWNDKIIRITYNLYRDLMFMYKIYNINTRTPDALEPDIKLDFLIDIFKQEAIERQKGNITFIHSRNFLFKIMNSFVSIIGNQNTTYLPKCKLKDKSPKKAREKYKEIYNSMPDDPNSIRPDNIPIYGERLISVNLSLLNNIYHPGESSFFWFIDNFGNMSSIRSILESQIKDKKLMMKINNLFDIITAKRNENYQQKGNTFLLFSFPENKLEDYVFTSNFGARIDIKHKDLISYLKKYLGRKLWGNDFQSMYNTQFRIMDLCYDKYGKKDGVEVYEFEQESFDEDDIEFTIKKNFTTKELEKLSLLTDIPSAISKFTEWPKDYRTKDDLNRDLIDFMQDSISLSINPQSIKPITPQSINKNLTKDVETNQKFTSNLVEKSLKTME